MTEDKYDVDAQDHEHTDEHAHDEHDMSGEHEPKVEAWQDDQPPVDDLLEESATSSEEEGMTSSEEEQAVKKKSSLLPVTIAIGGILIVGGAFVHWKMGNAGSSPMTLVTQATQKFSSSPASDSDTTSSKHTDNSPAEAETAEKTALSTDSGASSLQSGTAMPAASSNASANLVTPYLPGIPASSDSSPAQHADATVAPTPAPAPTPVVSPAPAPLASAADVIPAAPLPVAPPSPQPVKTAPPTSASQSAPPAAPVAAVNTALIDARISALSSQVSDLKKSLDKATQQLDQAGAMMAKAPPAPTGPSNSVLEDRLAKVEQQLTQLERDQATKAAAPLAPAAGPEATPLPNEAVTPPPARVASAHTSVKPKQKKPKPHKVVAKASPKSSVNAPAPVKTASSDASGSGKWVLRAATPGEAWVAKDATTPDLRHIKVGDELPGIGRVNAIQQAGDTWTVQGANGTIQ